MSLIGKNTLAVAAGVLFGILVGALVGGDWQLYLSFGAGAAAGIAVGIATGLYFALGVSATAAVGWFFVFHDTFDVGLYALAPSVLFGTLILFVTAVGVGLAGAGRKIFVRPGQGHRDKEK